MGNYSKNKGRSSKSRYVQLDAHMLESLAYKSLSFKSRAVYIEFKRRFYGDNNGQIHFAVKSASEELGCAINTVANAIKELEEKGFIICRFKGKFDQRVHRASEFILTEYEYNNKLATKDYMRWRPKGWIEQY